MDSNTQTHKILVVDDNPLNAKLTLWWCKRWGYETEKVNSGKSAIVKATTNSYDLILMDMLLPDMLGTEVFEQIHSVNNKTKIVFQSGLVKSEFDKLNKSGLEYPFLHKPYKPEELCRAIRSAFNYDLIRKTA